LPRSISARGQIAGVLGPRLQRAEPTFEFAAGRSDAATLVGGNRAVGEKGLYAGAVDDLQQLVGDGIIVRDHDIVWPLAGGTRDHFAGDLERLEGLALGIVYFERQAEALGGGLHALGRSEPIDFIRFSGVDERDGLAAGDAGAKQNRQT
jgi:hypothetical protein